MVDIQTPPFDGSAAPRGIESSKASQVFGNTRGYFPATASNWKVAGLDPWRDIWNFIPEVWRNQVKNRSIFS
ncbi:hypothetical protein J0895_06150 [Phormidium pseudopriestleyi FRX01]|uniref:Uncharacterized protein n=1 Tax=Phormidium pseudopriestleyi FRX01 TaxID=1759528 RepID=A0ABS3FNR4_9CYAN|nr:hypothetical protein [Phormidium pseudopriestleyi]MBO0348688.1 hypothetical protein [Phormidium pseudopriestleyi FRX01]